MTPAARLKNEERPSRSEQRTVRQTHNNRLDRKSPIQVCCEPDFPSPFAIHVHTGDEHTDVPLKPKPERPNHDDFVTVLTTLRYIAIWEKEQDLFESANRALEKVGKAPMENREGLVMNGEKSPG